MNFLMKNNGGFSRDSEIAGSNPLPRSFTEPEKLEVSPEYVDITPISTNLLITIDMVRLSVSHLLRLPRDDGVWLETSQLLKKLIGSLLWGGIEEAVISILAYKLFTQLRTT